MRRPDEPSARKRHGGFFDLTRTRDFRETEVDHLDDNLVVFAHEHQICRLDVAMNEPVRLCGIQRARDLSGDLQSQCRSQRPLSSDQRVDGFPIDEFHRVKIRVAIDAEVEDRCDMAVPQFRRGARFADEALPRRLRCSGRRR